MREQVTTSLRREILASRLLPGQRLVERELVERLEVSRTTIREALRQLASEGLVTVVPQKGARVSSPSPAEVADLYDVRSLLESLVVRRFVQRASDELVARLVETVAEMDRVVTRTGDVDLALAAKEAFYVVLLEGADSRPLRQLLESIQARVHVLRVTSLSQRGRLRAVTTELRDIVLAIESRNADRAARLCAEHVDMAARAALGTTHPSTTIV